MNKVALKVMREAKKAYFDCWDNHWEKCSYKEIEKKRNLSWKASAPVSKEDAVEIMKICMPEGYNNFEAKLLNKLPGYSGAVILAREYSVCVYVLSDEKLKKSLQDCMLFDEFDSVDKGSHYETRLWWD